MSRQCPLCICWVSPRAFVMLYTDPLSKVAVWLPVQLFSYSVSALFLSLPCDFFFSSVTVAWIITRGQQITSRVRQQKRQNKWEAAKFLILIRMGEVGENSGKCTDTQASLSYHLQNEKKKMLVTQCIHWIWSLLWSVMTLNCHKGGNVTWTYCLRARQEGRSASPPPWRWVSRDNIRVNEQWC